MNAPVNKKKKKVVNRNKCFKTFFYYLLRLRQKIVKGGWGEIKSSLNKVEKILCLNDNYANFLITFTIMV